MANPAILILDEATSSVDTNTEHTIQESLHRIAQGRTSLIIAHRLSTVADADRIIVMQKGGIARQAPTLNSWQNRDSIIRCCRP